MAEDKKSGKMGEFFRKHGEKLGLAAAAAALVVYLVMGVLMAKEDPVAQRLNELADVAVKERQKDHPANKAPELPAYKDRAVAPWNEVATAKGADDWAGTLRSRLKGKELAAAVVRSSKVVIPQVTLTGADVALDGVTINWSVKELTKKEQDELKKRDVKLFDYLFRPLTHFTVEREAGGKWEVLADKLPAGTTSYTDAKIEPKTNYRYRLTSWCTDKDYLARVESAGKGEVIQMREPLTTLGIWKIGFSNVMKHEDQKGQVYVTIEKFEKTLGRSVTVKHTHYEGDKIGWWKTDPANADEEPKSKHKISMPGGKTLEIDFDTGMTLLAIKDKKVTVERKKCVRKVGVSGIEPCKEPTVERVTVATKEITYKDDEGKTVPVYNPDPKTVRQAQDEFCEEHKPKLIAEVGMPGKPGALPAATKAREDEAEKVFNNAQIQEITGQKATALLLYQSLLKDYANTEFVKKQKKTIEDRLGRLK